MLRRDESLPACAATIGARHASGGQHMADSDGTRRGAMDANVPPASAAPEPSAALPPERANNSPFPPINGISAAAPVQWLGAGWRDLRRAPVASMSYGAAFAAMGWLIYFVF